MAVEGDSQTYCTRGLETGSVLLLFCVCLYVVLTLLPLKILYLLMKVSFLPKVGVKKKIYFTLSSFNI
jgi:hypothetical protein